MASTPPCTSSPGSRPSGAHNQAEAARQVREMFSRIAPRYDFLNHLLSFSLDRIWRRRVARRFRHILSRQDARALDLCCGTGDLTFALARTGKAAVFGSDFAHPMLTRAVQKANRSQPAAGALSRRFTEADALQLPFADESFDLVTTAFGFRNLANYEMGLWEMHRVLRPAGEIGILDFTEPRGFSRAFQHFYFRTIVPRVGAAISGNAIAYSYLPASVEKFPCAEELVALISTVGFAGARFELWNFGSVALHSARRP